MKRRNERKKRPKSAFQRNIPQETGSGMRTGGVMPNSCT